MRGQPDTLTPPHIVEAAERALRAGRTGYPDNQGEPGLRRAVAERLARDHGLSYDPDREILITDGATLGLAVALAALVEPNDTVLIPDPIYDAYNGAIALCGARSAAIPAKIRSGRFTFGRSELQCADQSAARAILINTPWNPVGAVLTPGELQDVIDLALSRDLFVISDEIYESLVYHGCRHLSPAALSPAARQRTVLINSLSKTYAMTGWRVGYCAGPPHVIAAMTLVLQQSSRGPATFVQDAAICALTSDQACVARMAQEYQARRDLVLDRMSGIPGVVPLPPEGGLFVMVDVHALASSSDQIRRFLLYEAGVVVLHGAAYGPGGEGTLRVSFAAGGQVLERGLSRLRDGLLRLAEEGLPGDVG
jgi:aspartate/methionine/tyrosine aminotransferase